MQVHSAPPLSSHSSRVATVLAGATLRALVEKTMEMSQLALNVPLPDRNVHGYRQRTERQVDSTLLYFGLGFPLVHLKLISLGYFQELEAPLLHMEFVFAQITQQLGQTPNGELDGASAYLIPFLSQGSIAHR
jgi:hypothetical protein